MSRAIQVSKNKILKLTNVLIHEISLNDSSNFDAIVLQMENYIKSKGALAIGPLINKTTYSIDDNGEVDFKMYLMRQVNKKISAVTLPFEFEEVIRVSNCIYAHYVGPAESVKIASDKIAVIAFEENLELSNESYTIYLDQNDDEMVADVFVKVKNDE
jgi:hypothetical protein